MIPSHNIYIHVPFCMSKCNYCAFFSRACNNPDWGKYSDEIISEISHWGRVLGQIDIPTIFFGGGTPSLMPVWVFEKIINTINKYFKPLASCEITLESNPGTLTQQKLADFCAAGVNRLSVGVQSLDDEKLKFLGRRHNADDAVQLLRAAQKKNIRVSADFIYGMPGDTVANIIKLCNDINSLGLTHCSMYELTIEPNTPFGKMNLDMPSNNDMADMYMAIDETLGMARYEVSNYAATGDVCKHNMNVWDGAPYIGIGRGAAGRIFIDDTWYEQMGGGELLKKLDNKSRAIERVITGMRMVCGMMLDNDTKKIINMDFVNSHPELVKINATGRIAATTHGMLVLDDLIEHMIKEDYEK